MSPLLPFLIILVAFLLRVFRIGAQELWIDEAYSYVLAAQADWFGPPTLANNTPPLYHFLLKLWMGLTGEDEAALRLLSALLGTIFVGALIWAGREVFTPEIGLWAAGFAAIAPFHIYYSQEARSYVLLALAITLAYAAIAQAVRRNTFLAWLGVTGSATLALYSHYLAVLGLIPTAALVWALRPPARRPVWSRYLLSMTAAAALFLPWLIAAFLLSSHPLEDPSSSWLRVNWLTIPPALAIPKSLEMLGLGGEHGVVMALVKQFRAIQFPFWARLLGQAALAAVFLAFMLPRSDDRLGVPDTAKRKTAMLFLLIVPLAILWLWSSHVAPIYVVGRYDILAFPAYCLILGVGLAKLRVISALSRKGLILAIGIALLLTLPLGMKLYLYYQVPPSDAGPRQAAVLDRAVRDGDAVVYLDPSVHAHLYYLARLGYRWQGGECRNPSTGRWFYCRFFPLAAEPALHGISAHSLSVRETRLEMERILAAIGGDTRTIWIVSGPLRSTDADDILFGQLAHLGFAPVGELTAHPFHPFRQRP